jgi:hypothetical protein
MLAFCFASPEGAGSHRRRFVSQQDFAAASISGYHVVFLDCMNSSQ